MKTVMALLLAMLATAGFAAEDCPQNGRDRDWSAQCFEVKGDTRQVKPAFVKRLKFNRYGMTTILIGEPREVVAVNRQGKVVVSNIRHTGDFDYPSAEKGVGRFYAIVRNSAGELKERCGYFKAGSFRIVVPAQFDHCDPFQNGKARVCTDCITYCSDEDCHMTTSVEGHGAVLGIDGKVRSTYVLEDRDHFCHPPNVLTSGTYNGGQTWLLCSFPFEMPDTHLHNQP